MHLQCFIYSALHITYVFILWKKLLFKCKIAQIRMRRPAVCLCPGSEHVNPMHFQYLSFFLLSSSYFMSVVCLCVAIIFIYTVHVIIYSKTLLTPHFYFANICSNINDKSIKNRLLAFDLPLYPLTWSNACVYS